jgi:hypothetical protein
MRSKVFFSVIVALYLVAPYFIYKYVSFNAIKEDALKVESGIANMSAPATLEQMNEREIFDEEQNNLTLQSYGYLAGGAVSIICPTILLLFRRRFTD